MNTHKKLQIASMIPFVLLLIWVSVVGSVVSQSDLIPLPRSTFAVNTTNDTTDSVPGNGSCADSNGNCSLRAAVMESNALAGEDSITIPSGTYVLNNTTAPGDEEFGVDDDLDILESVTITGAGATGASATIITAPSGTSNTFELEPDNLFGVTLTLNSVRIQSTGILSAGIIVPAKSTLNMTSVFVTHCFPGINNAGIMNISNSFIIGNTGDGIVNDAGSRASTVANTLVNDNDFIGVENKSGDLTIIGGEISGNSSFGVLNRDVMSITGSQIVGNQADGVVNNAILQITNVNISENSSSITGGGGITNNGNLTIQSSVISNNNSQSDGGAIQNKSGTLIIKDTLISGNSSADKGGGIYMATVSQSLSITNSTIYDNESSVGGGIYIVGSGTLTPLVGLVNTTISTNRATNGDGGGLFVNLPKVNINNLTITANTATASGGGVAIPNSTSGTLTLKNTIIAGNTAPTGTDCSSPTVTISANDHNLIGNATGCTGFGGTDLLNVNPLLAALADNGGLTQTHALQTGSPAINSGNTLTCITYDQRYFPRVGTCDIGAYEADAPAATVTPTIPATGTPVATSTPTPTATPEGSILELLVNGGFETPDPNSPALALNWTPKNLNDDKRKCNNDSKTFAKSGECAFMFKVNLGINSSIVQKITNLSGGVDNTLQISAWINGKNLTTGKVQVKITYADSTKGKLSLNSAELNAGTYPYTLLSAESVLTGTPIQMKVQITVNSGMGKMLIDDISLLLNADLGILGLQMRSAG